METNRYITFADKILDYNKVSEDSKSQIRLAFASCLELYVKYAWHDAKEVPKSGQILCQDKNGFCWTESRIGKLNWDKYAANESVCCWAYIDDLLPKGGR